MVKSSRCAAIFLFLHGALIGLPVSWENKKENKRYTNKSRGAVEKYKKVIILPPFKNINKNVLTLNFQVINNNTTRFIRFLAASEWIRGTTTKIQIHRVAQIKIPHRTKCNLSTTVWDFYTQISCFIWERSCYNSVCLFVCLSVSQWCFSLRD